MNFDQAFEKLIGHEGGYSNDPNDPGGETKFGISKRSYPHLDIAALTLHDAKLIYRRDFWDKCRCEDMLPDLRFAVFDGAVNSGVTQSVKWLQLALGVDADGVVGPITLGAAKNQPGYITAARYNGVRLEFMTRLKTWPLYGAGWARRIAKNLMEA